ncbi:hypothetical protein FTW19_08310 [Terriglobus albidus]|uniref:Uncharacterized protein n=1 Tax=Terriglobus albidus TaxID=1592106 RepID=A0A5B9ECF7_9BACT|nr:hypothetical protein [Terriglobus albidus]QEE27997.1 hypothetical protein FTW19_08310 [Terriglobus albidus]
MMPVLVASLLDPFFWGIIWFVIWCAYRLPRWSWIKLLLAALWIAGLGGIIVLQAHMWQRLASPGTDHKIFDRVLFPEVILGLILMFWRAIREERIKKQREPVGQGLS